jgi:NADPH-dependent 2,4-dienoyl-CoA reductase/sulfur reductase-like enzyme
MITYADLVDAGLQLRLGTRASAIDPTRREVSVLAADGRPETVSYDALVVGTGACVV